MWDTWWGYLLWDEYLLWDISCSIIFYRITFPRMKFYWAISEGITCRPPMNSLNLL
jgi:hypothetical protein